MSDSRKALRAIATLILGGSGRRPPRGLGLARSGWAGRRE